MRTHLKSESFMRRVRMMTIVFAASAMVASVAHAAVTPVAWYKLGEADPTSVPATTGNNPTKDSAGSNDLTIVGTPTYSSDVAPNAAGSTRSMTFGAGNAYTLGSILTTATQGVGLEAWVKAPSVNSVNAYNDWIVGNGTNGAGGFGFIQSGPSFGNPEAYPGNPAGHFYADMGGQLIDLGAVSAGTWVHLGVTFANGTGVATGYVNGVSLGATAITAGAANSAFNIGQYTAGGSNFAGNIDQVRVFTFEGSFNPGDFLIGSVPEPGSMMLIASGSLLALRRRRR